MKVEIKIPQGVTVTQSKGEFTVVGKKGTNKRLFRTSNVKKSVDADKIVLETINDRKRVVAEALAIQAHLENMLSGVNSKYNYKMRIVYSHFPITVALKGKEVHVTNFVGEKKPRITKVPDNVEVAIKGKEVIVSSIDKESAGIIAGLIEKSAFVKNRDRRVYQDGVYIIEKGVQNE